MDKIKDMFTEVELPKLWTKQRARVLKGDTVSFIIRAKGHVGCYFGEVIEVLEEEVPMDRMTTFEVFYPSRRYKGNVKMSWFDPSIEPPPLRYLKALQDYRQRNLWNQELRVEMPPTWRQIDVRGYLMKVVKPPYGIEMDWPFKFGTEKIIRVPPHYVGNPCKIDEFTWRPCEEGVKLHEKKRAWLVESDKAVARVVLKNFDYIEMDCRPVLHYHLLECKEVLRKSPSRIPFKSEIVDMSNTFLYGTGVDLVSGDLLKGKIMQNITQTSRINQPHKPRKFRGLIYTIVRNMQLKRFVVKTVKKSSKGNEFFFTESGIYGSYYYPNIDICFTVGANFMSMMECSYKPPVKVGQVLYGKVFKEYDEDTKKEYERLLWVGDADTVSFLEHVYSRRKSQFVATNSSYRTPMLVKIVNGLSGKRSREVEVIKRLFIVK